MKTESQEVFKKYTGIFAISSKGVIGYEVYKKGAYDRNEKYVKLPSTRKRKPKKYLD